MMNDVVQYFEEICDRYIQWFDGFMSRAEHDR